MTVTIDVLIESITEAQPKPIGPKCGCGHHEIRPGVDPYRAHRVWVARQRVEQRRSVLRTETPAAMRVDVQHPDAA